MHWSWKFPEGSLIPCCVELAVQVIAAYQGTALLTSALRDPGVMARESARIEAWLDSL